MYTISNKNTGIVKNIKDNLTFDYFDLITTAIGSTPAQGLDIAAVSQRCKLLEKFHKKNDSATLDADQYKVLIEAIKTCKWRVIHADLVTFSDEINALKPQE